MFALGIAIGGAATYLIINPEAILDYVSSNNITFLNSRVESADNNDVEYIMNEANNLFNNSTDTTPNT
jgi:hypothetical protein